MLFRSLAPAAAFVAAALLPSALAQTACNNSPLLCNRAYNNLTHLGAHDSPFVRDASTSFTPFGNQYFNSTVQLSAGVRLLTAQVHSVNNSGTQEWHLCHSSCTFLDAGRLSSWLRQIKGWMDANPNEVVTVLLVNSDNAPATALHSEFVASGINTLAYTPASTTQATTNWPTLQQMITRGTRLVTFVANLPTSQNTVAPYLLDEFTFVFENPFSVTDATRFSCDPDRPGAVSGSPAAALSSNRMFLMNHFLYEDLLLGIQQPNEKSVEQTNAQSGVGSLGEHLSRCSTVYGRQPTFVIVDFFNVGPAIASVDQMNGITAPVSRMAITTQKQTASSSTNRGTSNAANDFGVSGTALVMAIAAAMALCGQF